MRSGKLTLALFAICGLSPAPAQTPKRFEVASVRINRNNIGGAILRTPGGLTARNADFSRLVMMAFETREIDFSRVAEPLRLEHFDIVAKADGPIAGAEYWPMLRALLEERLHLKYHRERKEAQIYAMLLGRKGAALGPKIARSADPNCPVEPSGRNFCGVAARAGAMTGQRVSMARIALELTPFAGRPVRDRTRLPGAFDFQLFWTPDQFRSDDGKPKLLNGQPIDPSGPSLFTALQEQLGLKLEASRDQIEFLVIDHAEEPSDN